MIPVKDERELKEEDSVAQIEEWKPRTFTKWSDVCGGLLARDDDCGANGVFLVLQVPARLLGVEKKAECGGWLSGVISGEKVREGRKQRGQRLFL